MLGLGLKINGANAIPSYFISTWKTDNTSSGSSTDHQIKLPLEASGTYNFYVSWGDGYKDHITIYNQAEVTHTYTTIGTYTIKIKGSCKGFRFNNTEDRLKLLEISNWGNLELGNSGSYFYGCVNMQISAKGKLKNPTMTDCQQFFRGCTLFNSDLDWLDVQNIDTFQVMFYGCSSLNKSLNIFANSSASNTRHMFYGCTSLNQNINVINMTNVVDAQYMFYGCTSLNQAVSDWNTGNLVGLNNSFQGCTLFNQDISMLDFTQVALMNDMLTGATSWSTENYDKFLISAAAQAVQSNVPFKCSTKYTSGGAAEAARTYLQTTKNWTINDGGAV